MIRLVQRRYWPQFAKTINCNGNKSHNSSITQRDWRRYISTETTPKRMISQISLEEAAPLQPRTGISGKSALEFRDRLALIEACLRTGQLSRAHLLFTDLQNDKILFDKFVDVHVHNSFMEAHVLSLSRNQNGSLIGGMANNGIQQYQDLFKWFQAMRKAKVMPNATSFALLVRGALECNLSNDFVKLLTQDMKRSLKDYDVNIVNLMDSHVFEPRHVESLRNILSAELAALKPDLAAQESALLAKAQEPAPIPQELVDMPAVMPTKSGNLEYVKRPLDMAVHQSQSLLDQQIAIEQESFSANLQFLLDASDKRKTATGIGILPGPVRRLATDWHRAFLPVVQRQIQKYSKEVTTSDKLDISPFLSLFEKCPEKLSIVTISQVLRAFSEGTYQVKSLRIVMDIGEGVEQEYKMMLLKNKKIREKLSKDYFKHQEYVTSKKLLDSNFRKLQAIGVENNVTGAFSFSSWEKTVKTRVGSVLASWFMEVAKAPANQISPELLDDSTMVRRKFYSDDKAFIHDMIRERGKQYGVIRLHDSVARAFETYATDSSGKAARGLMLPKLLPMLVPPKPWLTHDSGGYLTIKTQCMRTDDPQAEAYMRDGSISGRLEKVFNGLDVLGQTPWRINSKLLKVMIEAWNTGKAIGGLPEEIPSVPPEPLPKPEDYETSSLARYKWRMENVRAKQNFYDMKSIRITENYKLEIARAFVGKKIYFPHNIDFRGRAYPIPQLFSHIGNDLARSLLVFEDAKPLGEEGLKWLQIHLANTFGYDKATFEERSDFAAKNMETIMKCAENPLGDSEEHRWWQKADKPWLFLSVAMELADAIKSGSPETYMSRLPVHQDGSCNGLQHYAALGGDLEGAIQVNLKSGYDRPQDVYSAVADMVRKSVEDDLKLYEPSADEEPLDFNQHTPKEIIDGHKGRYYLAKLLDPKRVERKTVKQTVMTSVYGVTFVGARDQVKNRLKEKYEDVFTNDEISALSRYLTIKVFSSLNNMFSGAREIQNWFANSAREIARSVPDSELKDYQDNAEEEKKHKSAEKKVSKSNDKVVSSAAGSAVALNSKSAVTWTTPIGLTVVQPYKHTKGIEVQTALQTFKLMNPTFRSPVDISKQTAAFPPNFIHSLDASHMIMTALECHKRNLTFASVHDSYWTHASDIPELRQILREKFVELHSQPILDNLADEFKTRYGDRKVCNIYTKGEAVNKLTELNEKGNVKYKLDKGRSAFVFDSENSFIGDEGSLLSDIDDAASHDATDVTAIEDLRTVEFDEDSNSEEKIFDPDATERSEKALGLRKNQKYVKLWETLELAKVPKKGTFDVEDVRNSEYFFN